tara:strand:+ start:359 stop:604 length:246 start_codon:yes stop_codon:yes gene_type:complete
MRISTIFGKNPGMSINNTAEYLKVLDEIAEFIDKDNLTIEEQRVLNLKKLAVRKYEMQEVSKYPAVLSLIDDFQKNKFFLN